jgi:hypothetical protein
MLSRKVLTIVRRHGGKYRIFRIFLALPIMATRKQAEGSLIVRVEHVKKVSKKPTPERELTPR